MEGKDPALNDGPDEEVKQQHDIEQQDVVANYDFLISWMDSRIKLLGYEYIHQEGTENAVISFVTGLEPRTLCIYKKNGKFSFVSSPANANFEEKEGFAAYFIRQSSTGNKMLLTKDNINREVQYGTVGGKGLSLAAFGRVMRGLVEKQVEKNNELAGQYHRCMATLTDTVHHVAGRTVLYCPHFEFKTEAEAAQDKERLQIMESIVIHWTRQIKDVVNNHDNSASSESSGPLDEIDFWKGRAQDLIGIQKQLEGSNVIRIVEVLKYAKSNYYAPFESLTQLIVIRAAESNDNLKFLESMREQASALRTIEPEHVVSILPDLLNRIRLIWAHSQYYNDNEHVCGILRKISNEIISRFKGHIRISEVLDGDVEFSIDRLKEAITCGIEWKAIFHKTVYAISRQKAKYGRVWESPLGAFPS